MATTTVIVTPVPEHMSPRSEQRDDDRVASDERAARRHHEQRAEAERDRRDDDHLERGRAVLPADGHDHRERRHRGRERRHDPDAQQQSPRQVCDREDHRDEHRRRTARRCAPRRRRRAPCRRGSRASPSARSAGRTTLARVGFEPRPFVVTRCHSSPANHWSRLIQARTGTAAASEARCTHSQVCRLARASGVGSVSASGVAVAAADRDPLAVHRVTAHGRPDHAARPYPAPAAPHGCVADEPGHPSAPGYDARVLRVSLVGACIVSDLPDQPTRRGLDFRRLYEYRHRRVYREDRVAVWNEIAPVRVRADGSTGAGARSRRRVGRVHQRGPGARAVDGRRGRVPRAPPRPDGEDDLRRHRRRRAAPRRTSKASSSRTSSSTWPRPTTSPTSSCRCARPMAPRRAHRGGGPELQVRVEAVLRLRRPPARAHPRHRDGAPGGGRFRHRVGVAPVPALLLHRAASGPRPSSRASTSRFRSRGASSASSSSWWEPRRETRRGGDHRRPPSVPCGGPHLRRASPSATDAPEEHPPWPRQQNATTRCSATSTSPGTRRPTAKSATSGTAPRASCCTRRDGRPASCASSRSSSANAATTSSWSRRRAGHPTHPGWYLNLLAHPDDVSVQIKGDVIPVRARTAEGDERTELWNLMLEPWPDYDGYQANTDREIPVVVLERR